MKFQIVPYLVVSWQVANPLRPCLVSCQVVFSSEPFATRGADEWPVVGVDPHLVSIHLPLAHGDVTAYVTAVLLGADMAAFGAEPVVHSRHVVVQGGNVCELLGRLPLLLAYLAQPVALFQVDAHHVALDTEHLLGVELTVLPNAHPVACLWMTLKVFATLLSEEVGGLIGQASLATDLMKKNESIIILLVYGLDMVSCFRFFKKFIPEVS